MTNPIKSYHSRHVDKRIALIRVTVTRDENGEDVVDEHGDIFSIDDFEIAAGKMVLNGATKGAFEIGHKIPNLGHVIQSMTFSAQDWADIGVKHPMAEQWLVKVFIENDAAWEAIKAGEFPEASFIGDALEESDD